MIGNWSETFASRFGGFSVILVVYLTAAFRVIFVHILCRIYLERVNDILDVCQI